MENIRLLKKKKAVGGVGNGWEGDEEKKRKKEKTQMQLLDLKITVSEIKISLD